MINFFLNFIKIIKSQIKLIIFILNLMILGCIFSYTILFYLNQNNIYLSNLIIFFSLTTLFLRLLYWHLNTEIIAEIDKFKLFLLRLTICTLIYLTPAYYIFKQESLVLNNNIILISLILISIITSIGVFMEKYLSIIESRQTVN